MNREQVGAVIAIVRMEWPHSSLGGGSVKEIVAYWHGVLGAYEQADVEAAVREIITSGRDHAPGPGTIAKVTAERITDVPEWDEAWREVLHLVARFGVYRVPPVEAFSHPTIAAFAIPAWPELCSGPAAGTSNYGTHHAQQREAYKAMRGRTQRDVALAAIGAPRRGELKRAGDAFADAGAKLLS